MLQALGRLLRMPASLTEPPRTGPNRTDTTENLHRLTRLTAINAPGGPATFTDKPGKLLHLHGLARQWLQPMHHGPGQIQAPLVDRQTRLLHPEVHRPGHQLRYLLVGGVSLSRFQQCVDRPDPVVAFEGGSGSGQGRLACRPSRRRFVLQRLPRAIVVFDVRQQSLAHRQPAVLDMLPRRRHRIRPPAIGLLPGLHGLGDGSP